MKTEDPTFTEEEKKTNTVKNAYLMRYMKAVTVTTDSNKWRPKGLAWSSHMQALKNSWSDSIYMYAGMPVEERTIHTPHPTVI